MNKKDIRMLSEAYDQVSEQNRFDIAARKALAVKKNPKESEFAGITGKAPTMPGIIDRKQKLKDLGLFGDNLDHYARVASVTYILHGDIEDEDELLEAFGDTVEKMGGQADDFMKNFDGKMESVSFYRRIQDEIKQDEEFKNDPQTSHFYTGD